MDTPERSTERTSRALGGMSVALGTPMILSPMTVARAAGLDDSANATRMVRAVGWRELAEGALLLVGPRWSVWSRVAGDAMDVAVLGSALANKGGRRTSRTTRNTMALGLVLAITAVDVAAAVRSARTNQHGRGRPGPLSLRASVTVNRPTDEVYAYWRDFENLPSFMAHLESVTSGEGNRSTWVAKAPLGRTVSWEAEMTGDEPGQRISWRSLPGADIDNSGTVHFAPAPGDRGTEVSVALHYDVPGGRLGQAVAKLLGEEPEQQVRDDLRRFKQVMETGDVVRSDAQPEGVKARHTVVQRHAQPVPDDKETDR